MMFFWIILLAVYLGIALLSIYFVIRALKLLLKSRSVFVWCGLLLMTLVWCCAAIWAANYIGDSWSTATKSAPAVGADWFTMLWIALLFVPLWLVMLVPSFPALITVLLIPPREAANEMSRTCARVIAVSTGPDRVFVIGIALILLAVAVRVCMWVFIQ